MIVFGSEPTGAVAAAVGDFNDDDLAVADATFGSGEARDGVCSRAAALAALGAAPNSEAQSTIIDSDVSVQVCMHVRENTVKNLETHSKSQCHFNSRITS